MMLLSRRAALLCWCLVPKPLVPFFCLDYLLNSIYMATNWFESTSSCSAYVMGYCALFVPFVKQSPLYLYWCWLKGQYFCCCMHMLIKLCGLTINVDISWVRAVGCVYDNWFIWKIGFCFSCAFTKPICKMEKQVSRADNWLACNHHS